MKPTPDLTDHVEGADIAFPPEYQNFLIYIDESGIHGKTPYYGWGSLWIPAERRGDLAELLRQLKRKHRFQGEVKWSKLKAGREAFAVELIDTFFTRNWIMFHALLAHRPEIRLDLFDGDITEARLHHLSTLLRKKIEYFGAGHADKVYHVRVDPLPSPYAKEHEKMSNITNAMLRCSVGDAKIKTMSVIADSRTSAGVQLADVLLGAVLSPWNAASEPDSPKARVSAHLFSRLGWPDHHAGTFAWEWKFNLWWLAEQGKPRHAAGRPCNYHFPLRAYRRGGRRAVEP